MSNDNNNKIDPVVQRMMQGNREKMAKNPGRVIEVPEDILFDWVDEEGKQIYFIEDQKKTENKKREKIFEFGPEGARAIRWEHCMASEKKGKNQFQYCNKKVHKSDITVFNCGCKFCASCAEKVKENRMCANEEFCSAVKPLQTNFWGPPK